MGAAEKEARRDLTSGRRRTSAARAAAKSIARTWRGSCVLSRPIFYGLIRRPISRPVPPLAPRAVRLTPATHLEQPAPGATSRRKTCGTTSSHILTRAEMASTGDASTEASTSDREYVSPGVIGACLTIIPNALMWYGAIKGKGKLEAFVKAVVKSPVGPVGLLAVPFCGMAMEKCFYDTLVSLQGVNPNIQPDTRKMETWPAGGHALPSFSVVPVKHIREYF